MARNLARSHDVRVWNRTAPKAQGLGARVAGSPAEAVEGVEVVIRMLADGPTVASVMDAVTLSSEAVWWQASTVGVDWARRLGDAYVDGPVMGTDSPPRRVAATITAL